VSVLVKFPNPHYVVTFKSVGESYYVCSSSILTKAHLTGGDVETGNLFGVVVNYCRVFPLSIANLSTKLDVIFCNI